MLDCVQQLLWPFLGSLSGIDKYVTSPQKVSHTIAGHTEICVVRGKVETGPVCRWGWMGCVSRCFNALNETESQVIPWRGRCIGWRMKYRKNGGGGRNLRFTVIQRKWKLCFPIVAVRCLGPDVQDGQPAWIRIVFCWTQQKKGENQGAEDMCKSDYHGRAEARARQGFEKAEVRAELLKNLE